MRYFSFTFQFLPNEKSMFVIAFPRTALCPTYQADPALVLRKQPDSGDALNHRCRGRAAPGIVRTLAHRGGRTNRIHTGNDVDRRRASKTQFRSTANRREQGSPPCPSAGTTAARKRDYSRRCGVDQIGVTSVEIEVERIARRVCERCQRDV